MQTMIRKPCLALLASLVALFVLAPGAAAQETGLASEAPNAAPAEPPLTVERTFALDLSAAVEPGDLPGVAERELAAAPATEPTEPTVQLAALDTFTDPNAWRTARLADASMQQNQSSKSGGGFGRWLKKRWYIPVLAAVVIGVTVADDDDAGEEDDD